MANKVRIIAGSLRGRNILFPDHVGLRPTLGRVRETMFAWLDQEIYGAVCLDLFAGSGALGFEACSRGAKSVVMFESDLKVAGILRQNCANIGCDSVSVFGADYSASSEYVSEHGAFDIVFIDPPYDKYDIFDILTWLSETNVIKNNAKCICEWRLHSEVNFPIMYKVKKLKKAGNVGYALLAHDKLGK